MNDRDREVIEFTINEMREHVKIHPSLASNLMEVVGRKLEDHDSPSTSLADDVSPAEQEDTHYTQGGVDEDKDAGGVSGFANGAK